MSFLLTTDLPISAVARGQRVDPATVWRWIKRGIRVAEDRRIRLPARKLGGNWRVNAEDLEQFIVATTAASLPADINDAPRSPTVRSLAAERAGDELTRLGI